MTTFDILNMLIGTFIVRYIFVYNCYIIVIANVLHVQITNILSSVLLPFVLIQKQIV